ncbi:uncharacterized protein LOC495967 [Xenopus laevis]|uniref:LOC495967 protein n=1 Tax=Xenopus laevis TaxID=8355 RepID=Q5PQ66_XENLA|nr:uncharacterized protein LOC495967 [Xenopus laevis]AAH87342.1 LOC495967 protein [Xenopus laevis]
MGLETGGRQRLFAWGANSYGQLGLGTTQDSLLPQLVTGFPNHETVIKSISAGGGHSAAVTDAGHVYVCGQNSEGQLGLNHTTDVTHFSLCPGTLTLRVSKVACGWDFTLILTDSGELLSCGANTYSQLGRAGEERSCIPRPLDIQKRKVLDVAAGLRHVLALTDNGQIFQWGSGLASHARRFSQQKPIPAVYSSTEPCAVPGMNGICGKMVAAGSYHCVALSDAGDVYVWGSNKHGQLLHSDPFLLHPHRVQAHLFLGERIVAVVSGWTHLVAQTDTGKVFTWGRANYSQLGRPPNSEGTGLHETVLQGISANQLPAWIPSLTGSSQVACGSEHNLAVCGGLLYSWGWNEHGMCGNGSETNVPVPTLVGIPPTARVDLIGCGAGHSMALCINPG